MQSKKEFKFESIPKEIKKEISSYLDIKDLGVLSRTSKAHQSLFQSSLAEQKAIKLFKYVEQADYDKATEAVYHDPALIFSKIKITNEDGQPKLISPLQQAFKVYDTYMWKIFLKAAQKNSILLSQFSKQLEEKISHIDLTPLIDAYRHYIRECDRWSNRQIMDDQLDEAWRALGIAQRTLPWHMLKVFCDRHTPWVADSLFNKAKPKGTCKIGAFYGGKGGATEPLEIDRLGSHFTLALRWVGPTLGTPRTWGFGRGLKDDVWEFGGPGPWSHKREVVNDLSTFRRLLQIRTDEFAQLTVQSLKTLECGDRRSPSCVIL